MECFKQADLRRLRSSSLAGYRTRSDRQSVRKRTPATARWSVSTSLRHSVRCRWLSWTHRASSDSSMTECRKVGSRHDPSSIYTPFYERRSDKP